MTESVKVVPPRARVKWVLSGILEKIGIRLYARGRHGIAVVYMTCEPASHHDRIMTLATRMPVLIEERI